MVVRCMVSRIALCLGCLVFSDTAFGVSDTEAICRQATQAIQSGDVNQAVSLLNSAITQSPRDLKALNLLGIALMTSGRRTEADSTFKKALAISPTFLPVLKNTALNEFALSRQADAETHFNRVLQLSPQDPLAHLYLGEIAFSRQQFGRALRLYQGGGGLEAKDPLITLHFAQTLLNQNQFPKAEALLNSIPPAAPAPIHFDAGMLLSKLEKYAAAAKEFELAQHDHPDRYLAGFNVVLTNERARNFDRAILAGEQLLAQNYRKAELFNLLATAYEQTGQTQKAYDALRTATQLDHADEGNYLRPHCACGTAQEHGACPGYLRHRSQQYSRFIPAHTRQGCGACACGAPQRC